MSLSLFKKKDKGDKGDNEHDPEWLARSGASSPLELEAVRRDERG